MEELYGKENNSNDPELLFKYETQIKNTSEVQLQPLLDYLNLILDGHILDTVGNIHSYETLQGITNNVILFNILRRGRPSYDTIKQTLYNYNYFEISYPTYRKLFLSEPYLNNDYYTRNFIERNAMIHAMNEATLQYNYLVQCMDFISNQEFNTKLDTKSYVKLIQENPNGNRYSMVKNTLTDGNLVRYKNHLPRMDMKLLTKDTARHLHNVAQYDMVNYVNENANMLGMDNIYTTKTWIWSGKVHTRHRLMERTTIPINDLFSVTNERTGEMCELRYPRDYTRDPSGSNTVNCGCTVVYNTDKSKRGKMNG